MEGRVMFWSVPVLGDEGYESVIHLEKEEEWFVLHVTSNTLEEHVWPTHIGQRVCAEEVVFDSPWEGRTVSCCFMDDDEEEGKKGVRFDDVPADTITGFMREEGALGVFFKGKAEVKCVDAENSKLLLDIGIGGLVQLFNVKVSALGGVFVTSKSGVRRVERELIPDPPPPSPPLPLGPPEKATKWICITCNYVNYPGVSVCRGCCLQRKQGPLKGSAWNFRFDSIPRRQFKRMPQWQCRKCRHRDNFYIHDVCVKCGETREDEERTKRKRLTKKK
jgi:hypothetical protein